MVAIFQPNSRRDVEEMFQSKGCLSNAEEDNEEIAKSSFQMLIGITSD